VRPRAVGREQTRPDPAGRIQNPGRLAWEAGDHQFGDLIRRLMINGCFGELAATQAEHSLEGLGIGTPAGHGGDGPVECLAVILYEGQQRDSLASARNKVFGELLQQSQLIQASARVV